MHISPVYNECVWLHRFNYRKDRFYLHKLSLLDINSIPLDWMVKRLDEFILFALLFSINLFENISTIDSEVLNR